MKNCIEDRWVPTRHPSAIAVCGDLSLPSGAQIYVREVIQDLLSSGVRLTVWTPARPGPASEAARMDGVEWLERPAFFRHGRGLAGKLTRIRDEARLLRLVRKRSPDHCLILADRPRLVYLLVPRRIRLAMLLQEVGPSCPGLPPHRFLKQSRAMCARPPGPGCLAVDRREGCLGKRPIWRKGQDIARSVWAVWLVRRMRVLIANSRYTARMYGFGSPRRDIPVIYPRIKLPGVTSGAQDKDPQARFHVGFIGRIEEEKGIFEALEILAGLPAPYTLTVIGEGTASEGAQRRIQELRLGARVRFLGWLGRDELSGVLQEIGVVLFPSLWAEGFGMVGAEALCSGTPVVAYDVGAVGEWCDSFSAAVASVGDRAGATSRILAVTGDPVTWAQACRAATKYAARRFEPEAQSRLLFAALGLPGPRAVSTCTPDERVSTSRPEQTSGPTGLSV